MYWGHISTEDRQLCCISKTLFAFRLLQNSRHNFLGDRKHFTGASDIGWGGGETSKKKKDKFLSTLVIL